MSVRGGLIIKMLRRVATEEDCPCKFYVLRLFDVNVSHTLRLDELLV